MEDTDVDSSVGPATEELKTAIETTTDAALSDALQDAPNNAAGSLQDSEHQQQDAIPELAADTGSPGAPEPPAALDGSPAELQGPAPAESSAGTSADSAAGDAAEAVANAASSPKPAKRPAVKLKAAKKPQEPIEAASSEPPAPPGDAVPAGAVEAAPAKPLLKPKPPAGKSAAAKAAAKSAAAAASAAETAGAKQDGEGEETAAAPAQTAVAKAAAKAAAAKAAGGSAADAPEQPVAAATPPAAGDNETSAAANAGPDGNKTAAEDLTAAAAAAKQPAAAKPKAAAAKPKPKPKPAAAEVMQAQQTAADASEAAEPAAKSPAAADAGPEAPDNASQPGGEQAAAAAPAAKPVASKKPAAAKKKPTQVAVAGDSKPSQLSAANSPIAAASTHGSNAARKGLHSLFGEASTLSVLSQEGSELPGSRPPAQLHAALDSHDHGRAAETEMNDEEQQEIQKIISEIHGNGNDSGEDESEDGRLADIKHHHLMPAAAAAAAAGVPGSNRNSVIGAMPSSLLGPQQQPADDLVRYEASGVSAGGVSPSTAVRDEELVDAASYSPQHAEEQQGRASPWPGVTQIQHELLQPDSSMEVTPAAHAAAAHSNQQHLAAGYSPRSYDDAGPSYTESAAYSEPVINAEGSMVGGGYEGLEEGTAEEEERSRAIAEQLAQLHEESRRLQLQSQLLQHRAIEMSLQMAATGNTGAAEAAYNSPAAAPAHQPHHISAVGALPNLQPHPQPEQQGLITGTTSMNSTQGLGFGQALSPDGMPLNPDALGLGDGELPRHPPGDSTPSSVTSSRAGLNWNIPSRGSIPSPGKVDSYSPAPGSPYLTSADAPRSNFSTIAQGFALHADPSLDYQMYSYHNNSKPAVASNSSLSETEYSFQQDQQQQQQRRQSLQQQQYPYQQQQQYQPPQQLQQQLPPPPPQQQWRQEAPVQPALPPIHHAPPPPPPPPAAHDLPASQHPIAAVSHTSGRTFRSQKSISKSSSGQKAPPPLVVRKPTLPVKQGSGASTRVAAAGATAGRRSSIDNLGGSYYGLVNEPPVVGTFNAAHAVAGAHGTVVKAKQQQQQQQQQGTGRVSPRGSMAAVPAAAAGSPKAAAGSVSAAAAAAAAAATSKLAGGSSSKSPTGSSSKGGSLSPAGSPTAAALAAAAAAAGSSGSYNHHPRPKQGPQAAVAAAAGPWGAVPVNPYAAAAMYGGGYAPVNPALVPMMMMNSKMQAGGNPSSNNKGVANKISPGRAGGQPGMMGPEALAAMAAAVPPGAAWMPMGLPPGFVPVMPQGAISAPGSKPSLGAKTHNQGSMGPPGGQNPMKAATGVLDASGKPRRGAGAVNSAPAGMQYGLPGMAPGAFMPMPGMPGAPYPPVGFNMPYGMGANPNPTAQQAGKHGAANPTAGPRGAKGSMQQAGYMNPMPGAGGYLNPMPPGGAYPAGAWGPMMGPPGQFGMMPMYAAPPGAPGGTMPGVKQQQQGGKGGKAAGGKGGWQS